MRLGNGYRSSQPDLCPIHTNVRGIVLRVLVLVAGLSDIVVGPGNEIGNEIIGMGSCLDRWGGEVLSEHL